MGRAVATGATAYGASSSGLHRIPEKAEQVLEVVAQIPPGMVATYGDIAEMVGDRGPRFVGNVMGRYGSDVPWWRVVRAGGRPPQGLEEAALEHYRKERTPLVRGVLDGLRVDLARARWLPDLSGRASRSAAGVSVGQLHHVEVWVTDLAVAEAEWAWLLGELGYERTDTWPSGQTWALGETYLVLEAGPDVTGPHERRRAGVNHLAFHAGSPEDVERLAAGATRHGWTLMFADRHPYAGGPGNHAAYLESGSGFEVELVAR